MDRSSLAIGTRFDTDLPARLDRLPWSAWHLRMVVALGVTWVLDGLEVTLVGSVAGVLAERETLHLSQSQIGESASAYLAGAIVGALVFGRLSDRFGRKKLFTITLVLYLVSTLLTALSVGFVTFSLFRAMTGAAIGGEYSAINSVIDELIPARLRGRIDLGVNSTYWLGTALGAVVTVVLLDPRLVPHATGWRLAFGLGAVLGLVMLFVRRHVPESPRWLLLHGRLRAAEEIVSSIEATVAAAKRAPGPARSQRLEVKGTITFRQIVRLLVGKHRRRSILGLSLIVSQAFAYNAIFFTYALVLERFYGVRADRIGLYILPFAAGNLLGPLVLGRLFDTVGRRIMIATCYGLGGLLLAGTGWAFAQGWLTATTQTILWSVAFFVVSSAASSAYLTVSELFPVELRALAIALFYAVGTAIGGLAAPSLLGALIEEGNRFRVFLGYALGGVLMLIAAVFAAVLGVAAEGKSLEALDEF